MEEIVIVVRRVPSGYTVSVRRVDHAHVEISIPDRATINEVATTVTEVIVNALISDFVESE